MKNIKNENQQMIVEVKRLNRKFIVNDVETKILISEKIPEWMLRKAVKYNRYLKKIFYTDGRPMWRQVDIEDYVKAKELGIDIPTIRKNRKKNLFKN